jgi:hypothetical protein
MLRWAFSESRICVREPYVLLDVERIALELLLVEVAGEHEAVGGLPVDLPALVDRVVERLPVRHQL